MSHRIVRSLLSPLLLVLAVPAGAAQPPVCEGLAPDRQVLYASLLDTLHPYDCCDGTISACHTAEPVCPLAIRLARDVCRLVKQGKGKTEIEHAMLKRAQSMLALGQKATVEADPAMEAGDPAAPVAVVVYACTRCPYCRVVIPALYREVTEGLLKGTVRLQFKPFPLKDHAGSIEGGLALTAAARMGSFWPYLLAVYERYDQFAPERLPEWAAGLDLDQAAFERAMNEPATREYLNRAKQEGVRNKVAATPALYVNGKKYVYEMGIDVLTDVLAEEYERAIGAKK